MNKFTLSALVATALWATAFTPALSQAKKPQAAPAASNVVGSVNGKPLTWDEVFAKLRAESPDALSQALGAAAGDKVAKSLFGPQPAAQVTITKADVLKSMTAKPPQVITNVVQVMLRDEALRQEAVKQNVNPSDADLDIYLNRMLNEARAQGSIPKEVSNDQMLAQRGLTRAKVRPQLRWQRQALNLIIKDMEKQQGRPFGPEDFIQARHILIMVKNAPPDAKEEDKKKLDQEALDKIKSIEADIKSGKKTFEASATEFSEDGSKVKGGDLGVFGRGQMVKEFETAAFALKPGQMSEPVRSQFGYHLIKLEKDGSQLTPDERKAAIDKVAQPRFTTYVADLMNTKYKIVNKLPQPPQAGPGMMGGGPRPNPNQRPPVPNGNPRPAGNNPAPPQPGSGN